MNEQETMWAGEFGTEYHERNTFGDRRHFWSNVLHFVPYLANIIELGCGKGENLAALRGIFDDEVTYSGVEINPVAAKEAEKHADKIYNQSVDAFFTLRTFDTAITRGFLIHLDEPALDGVFTALATVQRAVVMVEYHDAQRRMIPYHGHDNLLWADDFSGRFLRKYGDDWRLVELFDSRRYSMNDGTTVAILRRR